MAQAVLHTARWVLPAAGEPVECGGVAVARGQIAAVGKKGELQHLCDRIVDHGEAVIMPAPCNCHCHLELSGIKKTGEKGFTGWLRRVVEEKRGLTREDIVSNMARGIKESLERFTGILGDVTNTGLGNQLLSESGLLAVVFFEQLGLNSTGEEVDPRGFEQDDNNSVAPGLAAHAPYSCSPALIRALKEAATKTGTLFSMHLAESKEEVRFLKDGRGPMREFLLNIGVALDGWLPPGLTPVEYADMLGVLDEKSIIVHGVELTPKDVDILARSRAGVCLCPRSNASLGLGKAPVRSLLDAGVPLGLGTDSLASNHDLGVFGEMRFLAGNFPEVSAREIVEMATIQGARLLGFGDIAGGIEPGKSARLIRVEMDGGAKSPYDAAVAADETKITWLEEK